MNPLFRHSFFSTFLGSTFSTLFFLLFFWRSTGPGRYLIFFLVKFPIECRQNHVWGPIFGPSYDHIYKNVHLDKILTFGNALGPKIWPLYQIYRLWASKFWNYFKNHTFGVQIRDFEIISQIWSPNLGICEIFSKIWRFKS